jgi:LacI family transcriptional regulator
MVNKPSTTITIQDVAARAGVSAMTVSRVLNGSTRVSDATRQRIEVAIEELGYIPNALARGLLKGETHAIGLIVGDITNPYWTAVVSGAEEVAHRNGYALVLGNVGDSTDKAGQLIETMVSNRLDGLLINMHAKPFETNSFSDKVLRKLAKRNYPFVLIGPEHKGINTDIVRGDNDYGAQVLTRHLIELGHRRIALLNGPRSDFEAQHREQGYLKSLADYGIEADRELMVEGSYLRRGGYPQALGLLKLPEGIRPTAILASNNFLALSVIEAARDLEIQIPEDLALVGFDDFELASIIYPFLTVMAQPARVLGVQAAQLLIDRLNNPEKWRPSRLVFTPELIVRRSCGTRSQQLEGSR